MARHLVLLLLLWCTLTFATCAGLHMELTHVDAKAGYTMAERLRRAIDLTRRRAASMDDVSAPVHWATNQYIAEYSIGNPPQRAEALIDTGSDLIWTQCSNCRSCFQQNLPLYNFSKSNTVEQVPCNDTMCLATLANTCRGNGCFFFAGYGSGQVVGYLGTETFTFAPDKARLDFGCVTQTRLHDPDALNGASGLIGLGRGPLSLVSQTGATKFSYCLTPYFQNSIPPSHLFVGPSATLSGGGPVMSTPFVKKPKDVTLTTFYYLPLLGITVGKTKLPISSKLFDLRQIDHGFWVGGVLIDSGSPFTVLVDGAYQALRKELAQQLNVVLPPAFLDLDLCVRLQGSLEQLPTMVLHFQGGADMVLPPSNYWKTIDAKTPTACMMIFNGGDSSLIGNFQQQNMHLLYDLGKGMLSFQTADCSAL